MNKLWTIAAAAALMLACSGTDKEAVDAQPEKDIVAAGDGQNLTEVTQGDAVIPADSAEEDATLDVAPDENVGPQSPYTDEMLLRLCTGYCEPDVPCEGVDYGPDCVADCIALAAADVFMVKKMACAGSDSEEKTYCEQYEECPGDYEYNEDCVTLCDDVAACDALGTELFGHSLEDCALVCSGSVGLNPGAQDILDCIGGALSNCSGTEFFVCMGPADTEICEEGLCGAEVEPACSPIPGTFATAEECVGACGEWSAGQGLGAQMCLEMGSNLPIDCAELYLNCMDVPAAPADGALEYCKLSYEKCGAMGEGDDIYATLGGLAHDFCAWQMTGITQTKPDGWRSLEDAVTCMENLENCPSGNLSSLYCLINITEEHVATCSAIADICTDPVAAPELTLDCEAALGFATGFIPEAVAMIEGCVATAEDCGGLANCFFPDEEGDGQ